MGKKDVLSKKLTQPLFPYTNGKKSLAIQKYRDIIKQAIVMKSSNSFFVILGIENQTDIHYAMPVRNMLYNALTYYEQVEEIASYNKENRIYVDNGFLSGYTKNDKLIPVVTVTLYWGDKPWDAPTTLKEMLIETDNATLSLVDDVNCNLFSIVDTHEFPEYQTELKELFSLLNARNNGESMYSLVESDEHFKHISKETAEMMRDFANIKLPHKNKEGEYNMCKAVLDIQKMGEDKARLEAIKNIMKNGNQTFEQACILLGITKDDKCKYQKMI